MSGLSKDILHLGRYYSLSGQQTMKSDTRSQSTCTIDSQPGDYSWPSLGLCVHMHGLTLALEPLPRTRIQSEELTKHIISSSSTWQNNGIFQFLNSYSASHGNWCTATLWNRIMTAQCEGMGEVWSARYEPALLPPCPSIRVLSYSNCQEIHSRQQTGLAV